MAKKRAAAAAVAAAQGKPVVNGTPVRKGMPPIDEAALLRQTPRALRSIVATISRPCHHLPAAPACRARGALYFCSDLILDTAPLR
ncbi:hypothetical protein THASP1DRAFT_31353 [Thamnocephalis sphaerospora]|uniref:Uncharacterized protein n=1 Tax=Thamnocephalis sphaerospora TaxID=78915 RepID=A0A4P9XLW5_9FUNG|nr:hypothetical protein THASP1DRAFT_31353 [Thamnocephalis sphaerospora]|eukprot:RKP06835.1 hypothetical protein THASP1DRAFT_31353 [Thamnocephalis sphaerospora]